MIPRAAPNPPTVPPIIVPMGSLCLVSPISGVEEGPGKPGCVVTPENKGGDVEVIGVGSMPSSNLEIIRKVSIKKYLDPR